MTAVRLREWRGAKPVAGPSGATITTRLRITPADEAVLDAVAGHLGRLRRADLAAVSRPKPLGAGLDIVRQRQARRDEQNSRKRYLTALSSARWAHAIITANDARHKASRSAQDRHVASLRAVIETIEKRLDQPTADTLTRQERTAQRKDRLPKGYPTQAERFQKQRRLQSLRAELGQVTADRDRGRVRVTEGAKHLARTRHHLQAAGLTTEQWRERWEAARWRIEAIGSGDEPFGNLTITVTPEGEVSIRLPRPLQHLANARCGRYVLSGSARFALPAAGPVVGVDLNEGHLAVRRLDPHGNPVGRAALIAFSLAGSAARRDAQVRHAITRLIRYTRRHHIAAIAVEDLNFADARTTGRETMGRGRRGRRFRKAVAGIPTAVFRARLTAQTHKQGICLWAVNPAYTSAWGDEHWRKPYLNVTRHEAAATVIGRRAQGHNARRREGVTRVRPEDRAVRATDQAGPDQPQVNTRSRRRPGMRGSESRPPGRARTRLPGRATVAPAEADNGQTH